MNTDAFTTARHVASQRDTTNWILRQGFVPTSETAGAFEQGHLAGTAWARDHLAAQDARVRRDAARVAWHEGQASGWRSAQEESQMYGMVGDLYHPHTETEPNPYDPEETP